ncbi:MAG TPA: hypothetical protein VMB51_05525 [Solirubrobacteraceae bacterium]|nr:hypothetical protein [Solirubrobacteraceae bacterium]
MDDAQASHERGARGVRLADLLGRSRRVALVGLAKNTGKTETLAALLRELDAAGTRVGVTSIGRDGEARDVLDARIAKPRVRLAAGSLVATTGAMLRASGLAHERLLETGMRTPVGEVLVARVEQAGALEVAGPSAASEVRGVSEAMAEHGAERVLIDGAIDRRAASSPDVSDGLVMATGAILHEEIENVVAQTFDAVELVRLPLAGDVGDLGDDDTQGESAGRTFVELGRGVVLRADPTEIATLLAAHTRARTLVVEGALGERFLEGLLAARRERAGRELRLVVQDPTKVFLSRHGPGWYRRQGLSIETRRPIELRAVTVNPLAPQSHSFDSAELRERLRAALGEVPVLDVLDPDYCALA